MSIKIISRGKGRSAIAAAAYRAGERIASEYDGTAHDYTRKGGIAHTEILLPDHAPTEYADRSTLWNAVERAERNKNAQLAREIELALPVELSFEYNLELVRAYCREHFVASGMCADICMHDKGDGNPHAHIMLTMRPFTPDGKWAAKSRKEYMLDDHGERIILPSGAFKTRKVSTVDWNDQSKAEQWRAGWANSVNTALEQKGVSERIDHRSYERQGIEQIPTVHLGVAAFQMEKRGIRTALGDINRQVHLDNKMLSQLRARINKLKKWLSEEAEHSNPALINTLLSILNDPQEKTRYQKVADLKMVATAIRFMQENQITGIIGLQNKVAVVYDRRSTLSESLRKNERRTKTLDEHIRNADIYFAYRNLYTQYMHLKPKKQAAFHELHRAEIVLYESAAHYLRQVMNGRVAIPLKSWKTERSALAVENRQLYQKYTLVKKDVQETERIRGAIERIMKNETREKHARLFNAER